MVLIMLSKRHETRFCSHCREKKTDFDDICGDITDMFYDIDDKIS